MAEEEFIMWDSFSDHIMDMMKELMTQHDFADVTLISEDKRTFKAHKNILSSFSPFFKDILQVDASRTPFIFLRGISGCELQSIIHFIYFGNATFSQDRIKDLITSANILEIKGLSDFELENNHPKPKSQVEEEATKLIISEQPSINDNKEVQSPKNMETVLKDEPFIIQEQEIENRDEETLSMEELDDTVDNVIVGMDFDFPDHKKDELKTKHVHYQEVIFQHQDQNKLVNQESENRLGKIENKIEEPHLRPSKEFKCKKCDTVLKGKKALTNHMRVHKDYSCHLCDHKALTQQAYDKHMSYKHNLNFNCFMCDFKAEEHRQLKEHYELTHEGKREYKCSKCDYKGKTSIERDRHKYAMHKKENTNEQKVEYFCDKCPLQTIYKSSLRSHMLKKHLLTQSEVNESFKMIHEQPPVKR